MVKKNDGGNGKPEDGLFSDDEIKEDSELSNIVGNNSKRDETDSENPAYTKSGIMKDVRTEEINTHAISIEKAKELFENYRPKPASEQKKNNEPIIVQPALNKDKHADPEQMSQEELADNYTRRLTEIRDFRSDIADQKDAKRELVRIAEAFERELSKTPEDKDNELYQKLDLARNQIEESDNEIKKLTEDATNLEAETKVLGEQLETANKDFIESDEKNAVLNVENKNLTETVEGLFQELKKANETNISNEDLQKKYNDATEDLTSARNQIVAANGQKDEIEKNYHNSQEDLESARKQVVAVNEQIADVEKRNKSIGKEKDVISKERDNTQKKYDNAKRDIVELNTQTHGLEEMVRNGESQNKELQRQLNVVTQEMDELKLLASEKETKVGFEDRRKTQYTDVGEPSANDGAKDKKIKSLQSSVNSLLGVRNDAYRDFVKHSEIFINDYADELGVNVDSTEKILASYSEMIQNKEGIINSLTPRLAKSVNERVNGNDNKNWQDMDETEKENYVNTLQKYVDSLDSAENLDSKQKAYLRDSTNLIRDIDYLENPTEKRSTQLREVMKDLLRKELKGKGISSSLGWKELRELYFNLEGRARDAHIKNDEKSRKELDDVSEYMKERDEILGKIDAFEIIVRDYEQQINEDFVEKRELNYIISEQDIIIAENENDRDSADAEIAQYKKDIAVQEDELSALQGKYDEKERLLKDIMKEVDSHIAKQTETNEGIKKLEDQLISMGETITSKNDKINDLTSQMIISGLERDRIQREASSLESQYKRNIKREQNDNANLRKENGKLEDKLQEAIRVSEQYDIMNNDLAKELNNLEHKYEIEIDELREENLEYQKQLKIMGETVTSDKKRIDELTIQLNNSDDALINSKKDYKNLEAESKQEYDALKAEHEEDIKYQKWKNDNLRNERDKLKNKVNQDEVKIAQFKEDIAVRDAELKEVDVELIERIKDNKEYKKQMQIMSENYRDEINQYKTQAAQYEKDIGNLTERLEDTEKEHAFEKGKNKNLAQERKKLRDEIAKYKTEAAQYDKDIGELTEKLKDAKKENTFEKGKNKNLAKEREELRDKLYKAEKVAEDVERLKVVETEYNSLLNRFDHSQKLYEEEVSENAELTANNAELQRQVDSVDAGNIRRENIIYGLRDNVAKLEAENARYGPQNDEEANLINGMRIISDNLSRLMNGQPAVPSDNTAPTVTTTVTSTTQNAPIIRTGDTYTLTTGVTVKDNTVLEDELKNIKYF